MENLSEIFNTYLKNDKGELNLIGKLLAIIIIIIVIRVIISLVNKIIDKTLRDKGQKRYFIDDRRANTIGQVLKKLVKYVLYFIGTLTILEMFNIKTTSILATAGVGGLAIGFGAQSLVKDMITGFFIILEDQFSVGDYIQVLDFNGVVEELGMRVTKLRDFSGELHIIPNGEIKVVTNRTRGAMRALVEVGIAYEEDIDNAIRVIEKVAEEIKRTNEGVIDGPSIYGVTELGASGVIIRIVAKTKPMEQWAVEREIRKKVKEAFDRENIEIPYSKIVVYQGGEK
ncbi:MAG TPA: mechanosensitive ion channel family protein [Tissierellaceae bacterium]|nr:mechanosensitive ion channel family protein [Tissierellaceae bacterium]